MQSDKTRAGLEQLLAASLRPVTAPEALWEQVDAALGRRHSSRLTPALRAAAALVVVAGGGAMWLTARTAQNFSHQRLEGTALAAHREFLAHPDLLDCRTSRFPELAAWTLSAGGAALRAARQEGWNPAALDILGGRLIRHRGSEIPAVYYRVGGDPVTLVIAGAPAHEESPKHIVHHQERAGEQIFAWQSRGQAYALVASISDRPERACLICHTSVM